MPHTAEKGSLIYANALSSPDDVNDWVMEGPGKLEFNDGWMQMYSPNEQMHHVFWCPQEFPDSFIAEWEAQNLKTDAGLVILFFAAKAVNGEDIFAPHLPKRDGTFSQYTEGEIKSYHISYYTNAAHNPDRGHANLRKNNTFSLLQMGEEGIKAQSTQPHKIRLVKQNAHIQMFIDERKVIDYIDNQAFIEGVDTGKALTDGKIGFRQMQWTKFQYRNFKVWAIK
ncbi:YesU family protein [Catenovulum sp. 2E275]|uniref:YesU family protein n=1 Tax=Catenovulum sp. 2E275 TaxID=2980497 RepID=UPI0021D0EAB2|nr:YesU family protein [Catenovulum sp. 2E275]MCU4677261.1 YesU family protein [Catenovulum sp. 2E275]